MGILTSIGWVLVNLVQLLLACAWCALWITVALVAQLVTRRPDLSLMLARKPFSPGILTILLSRLEVTGRELPDLSGPHVYVCNHQSYSDIPALFIALPVPLRFIAKSPLFNMPFLGWYMRATGMIAVHPESPEKARRSLEAAASGVRDGASILAFPEGHRTEDGTIGPFKKGPFKLALMTGVSVVPIAIDGTLETANLRRMRSRPSRIRVCIGAPIETRDLSPRDADRLTELVRHEIVRLHRSIGGAGAGRENPAHDAPNERRLA